MRCGRSRAAHALRTTVDPHPGIWEAMAANEHATDLLAPPTTDDDLAAMLHAMLDKGYEVTLASQDHGYEAFATRVDDTALATGNGLAEALWGVMPASGQARETEGGNAAPRAWCPACSREDGVIIILGGRRLHWQPGIWIKPEVHDAPPRRQPDQTERITSAPPPRSRTAGRTHSTRRRRAAARWGTRTIARANVSRPNYAG